MARVLIMKSLCIYHDIISFTAFSNFDKSKYSRAVPFKSVGDGRCFEGRWEVPNSELIFPIRLYMISGRRGGGGGRIFNYLPFLPPPHMFPMLLTLRWSSVTSVVKIDSSPPVRFYQIFEWASKSLCLLAQKYSDHINLVTITYSFTFLLH